jgi:uncharacterized protein
MAKKSTKTPVKPAKKAPVKAVKKSAKASKKVLPVAKKAKPVINQVEAPWHVVKSSSIHSRGVFAARDIPDGTAVIEYLGERITKDESERRANRRLAAAKKSGAAAVYIFNLTEEWDLDGSGPGNTARLINHSCDPNCEALQDEDDRIWVHARRDIKANEELTFNYGFDTENWQQHPCLCGSSRCVGFIVDEEKWPELLKLMRKKAAEVRAAKKKASKA